MRVPGHSTGEEKVVCVHGVCTWCVWCGARGKRVVWCVWCGEKREETGLKAGPTMCVWCVCMRGVCVCGVKCNMEQPRTYTCNPQSFFSFRLLLPVLRSLLLLRLFPQPSNARRCGAVRDTGDERL